MKFLRFLCGIAFLMTAHIASARNIDWMSGGHVTYSVQKKYGTVVDKALDMFSSDMRAVTGKKAQSKSGGSIDIFQLDMASNKEMGKLRSYGVPYMKFITLKEAFWIGSRNGKLVVVGSDSRGTAYGILDLSRMAGVSPWIWWGDVRPKRRSHLYTSDKFETLQSPSVAYRGLFINDEDWSSRVWDKKKLDSHGHNRVMGPRFYHRLFELILRLRANMLWPAMHPGTTPFFQVKGNKEVADSFDICVGSSHCEPILRNNVGEWNQRTMGPYNFLTNRKSVENYWRERAKETARMDVCYTLGMRGIHDGDMEGVKTDGEKVKALQSVIDFQRKMLKQEVGKDLTRIPQIFVPYKEVLQIYENGLKVPDDVTLMWCDDNYGYLTRLSDSLQQRRAGGSGIYYHLSYWGRPHDYLWLSATQPGLIYHELKNAWNHNARRVWMFNIHDPKVAAYQLSLCMDMAWNINSVTSSSLQKHLESWLTQQFGDAVGHRLVAPMTTFYWLCGVRRPEFMGWNQVELDKNRYPQGWSPVQDTEFNAGEFGNELERYLNDYEELKDEVLGLEPLVRSDLRNAYFAAVEYPVLAAAGMAVKQLQAQEARNIGRKESFHHDAEALESAVRSWNAYQDICRLTEKYNNEMSAGKWAGSMNMAPRGLLVFQAPSLPDNLTSEEVKQYGGYKGGPAPLDNDGCVVRNACDYTTASQGATTVEMLGHSMKAVALPKGGQLTYQFYAGEGNAVIRTAFIPTQPNDGGDLRVAVSIDGGTPTVYSLREPYRSERWKVNVLRGQAVRTDPVHLSAGTHTLTIKALDDNVVIDQWMIDYNPDRLFYMFPVRPAL